MTAALWGLIIKIGLVAVLAGGVFGLYHYKVTVPAEKLVALQQKYDDQSAALKSAQDANAGLALENSALQEQVRANNITVLALQQNCQMKSDKKRAAAQGVTKSTQKFKSLIAQDKTHGPIAMTHFYSELRANE